MITPREELFLKIEARAAAVRSFTKALETNERRVDRAQLERSIYDRLVVKWPTLPEADRAKRVGAWWADYCKANPKQGALAGLLAAPRDGDAELDSALADTEAQARAERERMRGDA